MCEKLVILALASENVDEAVAALRKARKIQPEGKLQALLSPDWVTSQRERDAFIAEHDAFEEERRTFQRNIFSKRKKVSLRSRLRGISNTLFRLRRPVGVAAFCTAFVVNGAYGGAETLPDFVTVALAAIGLH